MHFLIANVRDRRNTLRVGRIRMELRTYPLGPLQSNLYMIAFGRDAFIVDPSVSYDILDLSGYQIRGIFCTHSHYDHIADAENMRKQTGAKVLAHEMECDFLLDPSKNKAMSFGFPKRPVSAPITELKDGDLLTAADFGFESEESFTISILHTPGHTKGSMCILFDVKTGTNNGLYLFSGDTVFEGSVGRTDLGGDMADMMNSVARLKQLPDDVKIFPGHGPGTTIGDEKRNNPYFTAGYCDDII
jgi:hydroxyacylglutathione hydrolase